jgi:serine protease DegS
LCKGAALYLFPAPWSGRVVDIDEVVSQPETLCQVLSHRAGAEALGGMMAGGNVVDTALAGDVHRLLRDLATQVGIRPERSSLFDIALGAAGTPGDAPDRVIPSPHQQGPTPQLFSHLRTELLQCQRLHQTAHIADRPLLPRLQAALNAESQHLRQLGVVAQFRVRIQRQVIGKQVDAMVDERFYPLEFHAGDGGIFTLPEITVVDEDRVGVQGDGPLDQRATGGDTAHQRLDRIAPLHLQAVGRVVLEKLRLQQIVQFIQQRIALQHRFWPSGQTWSGKAFHDNVRHLVPDYFNIRIEKASHPMSSFARSLIAPVLAGLSFAALFLAFNQREQVVKHEVVLVEQQVPAPEIARETTLQTNAPVSFADAVARAQPAVVNIYSTKIVTRKYHPLLESSLGSGVIVSPSGYVLTNNHVIAGATEIRIALADGRETLASVVGSDPETDLALLFIEMPDLPSITLAKSETVRVGDVVLAIGNPFGVGQTVTKGIVSALGRQNSLSAFVDFIQTDAAINPGNSGGALINAQGDLIGINSLIFTQDKGFQGISFAIPVDTAKSVMLELVQHGQVIRGWLGIEPQPLTTALANALNLPNVNGLLVTGIFKNGPAHAAGVRPGDIITHMNGAPIDNPKEAMNFISAMHPGEKVTIRVIRQKEPLDILATVGSRPTPSS